MKSRPPGHGLVPTPTVIVLALLLASGCDAALNPQGDVTTPPLRDVESLATAFNSCALKEGQLYCWGQDPRGEIADDMDVVGRSATALEVAPQLRFSAVALGVGFVCGLVDGQAHCWGKNEAGQLGDGTTTWRAEARPVLTEERFRSIVAGDMHACGITDDGRVLCWGAEEHFGVLATSSEDLRRADGPCPYGCLLEPAQLLAEGISELAAGGYTTCGFRGDQLFCWGNVSENRFRIEDPFSSGYLDDPKAGHVPGSWRTVALSVHHACAITREGELFCSGRISDGRLGIGPEQPEACTGVSNCLLPPTRVGTRTDWQAITVGHTHACGIAAGELHCWGSDGVGQLGLIEPPAGTCKDGWRDAHCAFAPAPAGGAGSWTTVSAGAEHTCAIRDATVYCWGNYLYEYDRTVYEPTPQRIGLGGR